MNHKLFFVKYAKEKGFDPLNPQQWYQQSRKDIMAFSKVPPLLYYTSEYPLSYLVSAYLA